mgnify:CR=1 FL=1
MPRLLRFGAIAALLGILFAVPAAVGFYTDWLWFGEVGFQSVYLTMLRAQGAMFAVMFAVTASWLLVNLRAAIASVSHARPVFTTRDGVQVPLPGRRQLEAVVPFVALIGAFVVALAASGEWEVWLSWRNAVPFGRVDPVLGRDISFFIFTLPVIQEVRTTAQVLIVIAAVLSGALYFVSGSLTGGFPARFMLSEGARRHLALLAAAFFGTLALGAWTGRAEYLLSPSGLFTGASYADVHGRMPAALLLAVVALVGAMLAMYQALSPRKWPIPEIGRAHV